MQSIQESLMIFWITFQKSGMDSKSEPNEEMKYPQVLSVLQYYP